MAPNSARPTPHAACPSGNRIPALAQVVYTRAVSIRAAWIRIPSGYQLWHWCPPPVNLYSRDIALLSILFRTWMVCMGLLCSHCPSFILSSPCPSFPLPNFRGSIACLHPTLFPVLPHPRCLASACWRARACTARGGLVRHGRASAARGGRVRHRRQGRRGVPKHSVQVLPNPLALSPKPKHSDQVLPKASHTLHPKPKHSSIDVPPKPNVERNSRLPRAVCGLVLNSEAKPLAQHPEQHREQGLGAGSRGGVRRWPPLLPLPGEP